MEDQCTARTAFFTVVRVLDRIIRIWEISFLVENSDLRNPNLVFLQFEQFCQLFWKIHPHVWKPLGKLLCKIFLFFKRSAKFKSVLKNVSSICESHRNGRKKGVWRREIGTFCFSFKGLDSNLCRT